MTVTLGVGVCGDLHKDWGPESEWRVIKKKQDTKNET